MDYQRFNYLVADELSRAGWFPDRSVAQFVADVELRLKESDAWEMFPAARRVLLEFGGLHFDQKGAGISLAREPFQLEPTLAVGESDRFQEYENLLKMPLYPLGEAANGNSFLAISQTGAVYYLMDDLLKIADNFDDALKGLIRGVAPTIVWRDNR